jgi:hypothetical protein
MKNVFTRFAGGWTASICDNISCFGDIPAGSTMSAVITSSAVGLKTFP